MKYFFVIWMVVVAVGLPSNAGPRVIGNGINQQEADPNADEFYEIALDLSRRPEISFELRKLSWVVDDLAVESTDERLLKDGVEVNALSSRLVGLIVFNRDRWGGQPDLFSKRVFVLHELLVLLGIADIDNVESMRLLRNLRESHADVPFTL